MKFNAVIGNPPYQITKGGTKNVTIWQHFVELGNKLTEKWASFIHPGSWVSPKQQMKSTQQFIIDSGLQVFDYYNNPNIIFPNVSVHGGISIEVFKKGYNSNIEYFTNGLKASNYYNDKSIFYLNKFEEELNSNIQNNLYTNSIEKRKKGTMSGLGSNGFGYAKDIHYSELKDSNKNIKNPIRIYTSIGKGSGSKKEWKYISQDVLNDFDASVLNSRKIIISKTGGGTTIFDSEALIGSKDSIATSYLFFPEHDTLYELKLIQSLLSTKTARALMNLTQKGDIYSRGFENIPDYTYFMKELQDPKDLNYQYAKKWKDPEDNNKEKGLFTDEWFYHKFNFSKELIDYIETHISKKEIPGE